MTPNDVERPDPEAGNRSGQEFDEDCCCSCCCESEDACSLEG
jgi:hypothetical protein